jgi:predicted dienelactone hydrolase
MPFAFKTRREAESLGMADLPLVVLPHPLSSRAEEVIRRFAAETLDEVEYALSGSVEALAARYHQRVTPFAELSAPATKPIA